MIMINAQTFKQSSLLNYILFFYQKREIIFKTSNY